MMSLALAALFFARLAASAPAPLVARAPASVVFNSPESILATCSAPVTLSWSVRPSTDDEDDTAASDVRVSRVVVASTKSDFTRTLVADPESFTFTWEQVNVPPGEYVITGLSGDDDVQVRPSTPFTVRAGESTDCIESLVDFSSSSSSASSTTPAESTTVPSVSIFEVIRTQTLDAQTISSASPSAATGSSGSANTAPIVGIVVVVIITLSLGLGWFCWRRLNRARQLVDIEYVYPPGLATKPKLSSDEAVRRSSDETVIEIHARAPTPVGMLSRTTTKQMLAEDLDPTQTQKMLRQL